MSRNLDPRKRAELPDNRVAPEAIHPRLRESIEYLLRSLGETPGATPPETLSLLTELAVGFMHDMSVEAAELAQNSQVTSGHVRFLIRNHEDMVEKCNIILSSDNDLSEEKRSRKGR